MSANTHVPKDEQSDASTPLVSVIIPTWNAAPFLATTLDSILSQTWPSFEVIVVDDGSTDETGAILASYGDSVRVITIANSGGPSRPRNIGIERAHGDFIALFDSDDRMDRNKLADSVEVFQRLPEVDLVFTNFRSIDPDNCVLCENYLEHYCNFRRDLVATALPDTMVLPGKSAFRQLIHANFIGTSSVLCRKESLDAVGSFDESMKNADDIDMWLRMADHGCTFAFLDRVLHSYRITSSGISSRGGTRISAIIAGLQKHINGCHGDELEAEIEGRIGDLYAARAWSLRKKGHLNEACRCYSEALRRQWKCRTGAGLFLTWVRIVMNKW